MTDMLKARIAGLMARYDAQALSVEPPAPLPSAAPHLAAQQAALQKLHAWCARGAGGRDSPFLRPWQRPALVQPVSVAVLRGAQVAWLAEAFSRQLDGSDQLAAAGGRWAGLWLRLRVKFNDAQWWRARQPTDPWDAGYLLNNPVARQALRRFVPRRATLLVASGWPADAVLDAVATLQGRRAAFLHPVRLLVVETAAGPAPGQAAETDPVAWRVAGQMMSQALVIELDAPGGDHPAA